MKDLQGLVEKAEQRWYEKGESIDDFCRWLVAEVIGRNVPDGAERCVLCDQDLQIHDEKGCNYAFCVRSSFLEPAHPVQHPAPALHPACSQMIDGKPCGSVVRITWTDLVGWCCDKCMDRISERISRD